MEVVSAISSSALVEVFQDVEDRLLPHLATTLNCFGQEAGIPKTWVMWKFTPNICPGGGRRCSEEECSLGVDELRLGSRKLKRRLFWSPLPPLNPGGNAA